MRLILLIFYFENIISDLEKKNLELQSSAPTSDTPSEEKYYISYDNKKENVAIIDDKTFVMEMYDLFEPKFKQIGIFDIIEYENDIVITEQWITNVNVICK